MERIVCSDFPEVIICMKNSGVAIVRAKEIVNEVNFNMIKWVTEPNLL
jgi:hypothetical protein